jgi:hypothetical protein
MMRTLVALLALTSVAGPAAAQTCFRPRPAPACRSFWILEVSSERRDGSLGGQALDSWVLGSGALGGMTNLSSRWALGGALVSVARGYWPGEGGGVPGRFGVVVRGRRWLGGSLAVDLTAGLWRLSGPSPMAELAVEAAGVVGVSVGVRGDPLWPRSGEVYVGLRWSSFAAPVAVLAGVLTALSSLGGT